VSGVIWISGGAKGIGLGLAVGLAREGWKVAVSDIDRDALEETQLQLSAAGTGLALEGDVSVSTDNERIIETIESRLGPLDALVNNAFHAVRATVLEVSEADWRRALEVNLTGYFLCAQSAARRMAPRKQGRIVNMSSGSGERGIPGTIAYGCAKGGLNTMTRIMAVELAEQGILVNTVTYGPVLTTGFATMAGDEDGIEARRRRVPLGRLGEVEDCIGILRYLLSDDARWTTGALFHVDGGANNATLVQQMVR
jgi:NAD(P)-dependent dehydrogenase (short-subunit alcohol dehydrogenase family)